VLSPYQAIRPWSAALAQSDQHAHRRFLEQADGFRYDLVQRLNRALIHRPLGGKGPYMTDVAAVTRDTSFVARPGCAKRWRGTGSTVNCSRSGRRCSPLPPPAALGRTSA
jgi:hypothetical protein